jgi:hypothetical protein
MVPAENWKGTPEIVQTLLEVKKILETQFHFRVVGLAFDSDSCFSHRHAEFAEQWRAMLESNFMSVFISIICNFLFIPCDLLHFLKRIRCHLLKIKAFIWEKERIDFSIK